MRLSLAIDQVLVGADLHIQLDNIGAIKEADLLDICMMLVAPGLHVLSVSDRQLTHKLIEQCVASMPIYQSICWLSGEASNIINAHVLADTWFDVAVIDMEQNVQDCAVNEALSDYIDVYTKPILLIKQR